MTEQEFIDRYKQKPIQDDLERANCIRAGSFGHSQCGICDQHDKPRFMCGCSAKVVDTSCWPR